MPFTYESQDSDATIQEIRDWINDAKRVVVLTGAGISTDSGIPDFRGPDGIWTRNPRAEKTATLQHFLSDPELRKQSWRARLESSNVIGEPNAGHRALVALERRGKLHKLITQNVDGLHLKAGNSPKQVIEIHGNTREALCMSCGKRTLIEDTLERVRKGEEDPRCAVCDGILKSATISFGQSLIEEELREAKRAVESCDLLLVIGTTLAVHPIAGIVPIAKRAGARIVIVNGEPTSMDHLADRVIRGPISELLQKLLD